jgi:cytidylate kinase
LFLPNTVAVDGPAASGKSAVSFAVAQRLGYLFADTGAFYRAITFLALEQHFDVNNTAQIAALAERTHLDITPDLAEDGRQYTLWADRRDITCYIHTPIVDASVSIVAANPGVRAALMDVQHAIAARGRVIMAGRDIGTTVLPNADLKIYIDAGLEERALRRYHQHLCTGEPADLEVIRDGLRRRDAIDQGRETAPLRCAPDAVCLDTSALSLEEAIEAMYQIVVNWDHP